MIPFLECLFGRAVREAEANFQHMHDISNLLPCMKNLSGQHSIELNAEEIDECDEKVAKSKGKGFIKQYYHFKYDGTGRLLCKYMKGDGQYFLHEIVRSNVTKDECGICGDPEEDDNEREWEKCKKCKQWYHRDCIGDAEEFDDESSTYWECKNC